MMLTKLRPGPTCPRLYRSTLDNGERTGVWILCQSRNNPKRASGVASVAQPVTCGTWQSADRL
jgi:hypothetical protein